MFRAALCVAWLAAAASPAAAQAVPAPTVAAFSLGELDAGVGTTEALLVYQREGQPLSPEIGPFRLVVPTDKRAARWVRNLVRLSVSD